VYLVFCVVKVTKAIAYQNDTHVRYSSEGFLKTRKGSSVLAYLNEAEYLRIPLWFS